MLFEKIELETDETVITIVRKHWFVITIELFFTGLLAFIPAFLYLVYKTFGNHLNLPESASGHVPLIMFAAAAWLIVVSMVTFTAWTHYYLDLWIVTDRRIIVIDQIHFFYRKINSFRLERLQDIKVSINGLLPTLLDFGTLRAQTAGAVEDNFRTDNLPRPRELQAIIQRAMDMRLRSLHQTDL